MPSPIIQVRTLGAAEIDVGAVQIRPNASRTFAALLYLSAETGRPVPRRILLELIFPDHAARNARHSLRELVYRLRRAGLPLRSDAQNIEISSSHVSTDYAALTASERLTRVQIRAAEGGFLPGYGPAHSEAFCEWYDGYRARILFELSKALLREVSRAKAVGDWETAESAARACLVLSPLNEEATLSLAETLAIGGAKAAALDLLGRYMTEVGAKSPDLKVPAASLRRRISEEIADGYHRVAELPLAGRESEMLELRQRLTRSLRGHAETVIIAGDAGIGKTRLVTEFTSLAQLESTHLERVVAHPSDRGRPMGVITDLVRPLLQLPGALGIAPTSMQALRTLTSSRGAFRISETSEQSSESVSLAITLAIHDVISAVCAETHLTIVIEDAHWVDSLSLRVLSEMAAERDRQVLLILTTRDTASLSDPLWLDSSEMITLRELDMTSALYLSRRGLQGTIAEGDESVERWMTTLGQGNPLFLVSLVTHFRTTGELFKVPASLHELLARRLDSLPANSTAVLQASVILGTLATDKRLIECLEMPFGELITAVAELERRRMISCSDGKMVPAHPLLAEVLQARSSTSVLRLLHLRVATLLERDPDCIDSPTLLWHCAEHLVAASEHGRALEILRKCAEHAHSIGRPAAAAEILLKAAKLQIGDPVRIELLKDAVRAGRRAREHDLVLEAVATIRRLSPAVVHDEIEIAELTSMSAAYVESADFQDRVLCCLHSTQADADHRVRVAVAALMYSDTYSSPALARSVAAAISESDLAQVDELLRLEFRILYHAALGEPAAGAPFARRMQELVPSLPLAAAVAVESTIANAYWRAGLVTEAIAVNRHAYELAETCGAVRAQLITALRNVDILSDEGDETVALLWLGKAHAVRKATGREVGEFDFAAEEIAFALAFGDGRRAAKVLNSADRRGLFSTPIRRRWRRCFATRIRQMSDGDSLSNEEIGEILADWSDGLSTSGIRDSEAIVLCAALTANGRREEARTVLRSFFAWRRHYSHAPIPWRLRQEIVRCGLANTLQQAETTNAANTP